jgi:hypothetical protein
MFLLLRVAAISVPLVAAACGAGDSPSDPAIALRSEPNGQPAYIEVTGLSGADLRALRSANLAGDQWARILRVAVSEDAPGILGSYAVADTLRFTPQFALDPGRQYFVKFDPAQLPGAGAAANSAIRSVVSIPAANRSSTTTVARVYPSGDTVPENLLRMYVEFSGPMARPSGIPHMKLLGSDGREIVGAFLPLDYEFWDPAHTRFTAFLDPGRVKSGILPNKQMGAVLDSGRTVTLVVSREWRDEHGQPLKDDFRRVFKVGPPAEAALEPHAWTIEPPASGSRSPLVVTFPSPLDHGLLMRALGVTRDGVSLGGDVTVAEGETRWTFAPREPWRAGEHHLLALDSLEDPAGNQIGRAFEVRNVGAVEQGPAPQRTTIPFRVNSREVVSR